MAKFKKGDNVRLKENIRRNSFSEYYAFNWRVPSNKGAGKVVKTYPVGKVSDGHTDFIPYRAAKVLIKEKSGLGLWPETHLEKVK